MKSHAKDYLIDLSKKQPIWFQELIKQAIETNGNISEQNLNEIFESCVYKKPINSVSPTKKSNLGFSQKLKINSLTHVSGVNALAENQTIKFSPDVTVLYGLNGSGKSSYFKILNEIVGGNQKKSILPNIYVPQSDKKPVVVKINYSLGDKEDNITWNNTTRALEDFVGVKVFDSSYQNGLIDIRTPDRTVINPLGLHLFSYIATLLDNFSDRLDLIAKSKLQNLPAIDIGNFSEKYKNLFSSRKDIGTTDRNEIKEISSFSNEENDLLETKQKLYNSLRQVNDNDRIKVLTNQNNQINILLQLIKDSENVITEKSRTLKKALSCMLDAKEKNNQALKQSEILKDIPYSDSEEWKSFIQAGEYYSNKLKTIEYKNCPYCHQELALKKSIDILSAYTEYLNDNSEKVLQNSIEDYSRILKEIEYIKLEIPSSLIISEYISDINSFTEKLKLIREYKTKIVNSQNPNEFDFDKAINFENDKRIIEKKLNSNIEEINEISKSLSEKQQKLILLNNEINDLLQRKSLFEQKDQIKRYFDIYDEYNSYQKLISGFSTRNLTLLANQAQNELLTKTLESKLTNELGLLGRNDLKVKLVVSNGKKGQVSTRLELQGNHSVSEILSEGEQKAVGLAVFFAEIQNENVPIILDDPITSLDHEIASNVAKRILQSGNQTIVFCHNRLFLDGFETSKENHVCKTIQTDCNDSKGKHIYIYRIYGDGLEKGIISEYKGETSDSLIRLANTKLNKRPFEDYYGVSIVIRRAVEKIIDEKVFNNLVPPKFSTKNSRINWDDLKKLNSKPDLVQRLRVVHDAVSEGEHDGTSSLENPITIDKLKSLVDELKIIKDLFSK